MFGAPREQGVAGAVELGIDARGDQQIRLVDALWHRHQELRAVGQIGVEIGQRRRFGEQHVELFDRDRYGVDGPARRQEPLRGLREIDRVARQQAGRRQVLKLRGGFGDAGRYRERVGEMVGELAHPRFPQYRVAGVGNQRFAAFRPPARPRRGVGVGEQRLPGVGKADQRERHARRLPRRKCVRREVFFRHEQRVRQPVAPARARCRQRQHVGRPGVERQPCGVDAAQVEEGIVGRVARAWRAGIASGGGLDRCGNQQQDLRARQVDALRNQFAETAPKPARQQRVAGSGVGRRGAFEHLHLGEPGAQRLRQPHVLALRAQALARRDLDRVAAAGERDREAFDHAGRQGLRQQREVAAALLLFARQRVGAECAPGESVEAATPARHLAAVRARRHREQTFAGEGVGEGSDGHGGLRWG